MEAEERQKNWEGLVIIVHHMNEERHCFPGEKGKGLPVGVRGKPAMCVFVCFLWCQNNHV